MATPNLDNLSLEELEKIMTSQQDELAKLDAELAFIEQMETKMNEEKEMNAPAADPAAAPAAAPAAPVMPMDEFGMGMTPEKIQQATAKLVEAGMFDMTTGEMTPDLVAALQSVANLLSPGLYDLSQPDQIEEFINGINDGTIALTPAAPAAPAAGTPVPGAGLAGIPGSGSLAQLGGAIPGTPPPII